MTGAPLGEATSPVMFEREAESARLEQTLSALTHGDAGIVVISGEAGIGKTRLIDEALTRFDDTFQVLRAECLALGSSIPYLPFAELLRDLARQLPGHRLTHLLGPARDELARFLPEIALAVRPDEDGSDDGRGTPAPRGLGGELERLRLYETFLRVTERIAAERPTVVVIEDVQWIDQASLELLAFLAHGLRRHDEATLIISVRPEEIEDKDSVLTLLAELGRSAGAVRIELSPLSAATTERIAAAVLGAPPDEALAAHVQELSDGNPLFAEELLAAWRRRGPDASLPPKLRDLLAARLAQVPDEVLEVLRVAAAAGRRVDDQLLMRASGLDEDRVQRAVHVAVDEHILVRSEGPDGSAYRFRHEILRSVVAAQLLPAEARRVHAAYAAALAEEPAERRNPTELADHWDAAGEPASALAAHVEAGHAAVLAFAFDQANRHFERALALWPRLEDAPELASVSRAELIDSAASAAARAGSFDRAIELTRELIEERDALEDDVWQLARSSLRWYLFEAGQLETALQEAELVLAEADVPPRWRANALGHAAASLLYLRRTEEAAAKAAEARAAAEAAEAQEELVLAEGLLGWCRLLGGDVDEGLEGLRRTLEGARAVEGGPLEGRYPVGTALAQSELASALELSGRLDEAHEVAVAGAATAAAQGVARTLGSTLEARAARALYQLGRWDEAAAIARPALEAGAVGAGRILLLACLALIDVARGRSEEAATTIAMAEGLVTERTPLDVRRWLTAAAMEHALWSGDPANALARLALAADDTDAPAAPGPGSRPAVLDASAPYLLALGARACADAARAERASGEETGFAAMARSRVEDALERASAQQALSGIWTADLTLARAELARAGDATPEERVETWRDAHAALAVRPYTQAYAGWRLAEAWLGQRSGRDQAHEALKTATSAAVALGAKPLADELGGLATRARLDLGEAATNEGGGADRTRAFGLTQREAEVLALLAQGLANQEIAERLFISPKTASVHVSNIYGKLGVDSRVAAATLAHEMGLDLPPDEAG